MKTHPRNVSAVVASVLLSAAVSALASPLFTKFGVNQTEPLGLSSEGTTVTGLTFDFGSQRAFRWTSAGGMEDLGVLAGDSRSEANAVNGNGSVIVGRSDNATGGTRAFRWTAAGGMENLGTLPGGNRSIAHGVSGDGSAVVGYSHSSGGYRAFRWTAQGIQSLGVLPGGADSFALGISADGSVVVGSGDTPQYSSTSFRWTSTGGMQDLGVLGSGLSSGASAVSADGSTIVGYSSGPTGVNTLAFRWTGAGGMQGLGLLPGDVGAEALAVSGDGSIVVGRSYDGAANQRAFLWTDAIGMVDLNSYLSSLGVTGTAGDLQRATGISSDGSAIAGITGDNRGWIVTGVPEPASAVLLLAGGALLAVRRNRSLL
jgi:probable HAF family extracellular repeat protein